MCSWVKVKTDMSAFSQDHLLVFYPQNKWWLSGKDSSPLSEKKFSSGFQLNGRKSFHFEKDPVIDYQRELGR